MAKLDNVKLSAAMFQSVFNLWTLKSKFHLISMSQNVLFFLQKNIYNVLDYSSNILTLV